MPPGISHPSADGAEKDAARRRPLPRHRFASVVGALVLALGVVGTAGCSDDVGDAAATTEPNEQPPAEETTEPSGQPQAEATTTAAELAVRTVDTEMGPVELPADPQRIVALDEYAAMNLLALGIEPAVVLGSFGSQIDQDVLTGLDIEVTEGSAQSVNFEAVAADEPDLIVSSDEPAFVDSYDELSQIAPTVVLPFNQPWRDMIQSTATIFDRTDEAERLIALLEGRIDELAAEVQVAPQSISLLGSIQDMLFAISSEAAVSGLIDEVGFTRPVAQAEGAPVPGFEFIIAISSEVLGDHDGDLVVVYSGGLYNAEAVTSLPTYQTLPAVIDGRAFEIDGSMWFGTYPFATYWILEDLAALTAGEGQSGLGTLDDAADRWSGFEALIE